MATTTDAPRGEAALAPPLLAGRRILVTGVLTERSIAFGVAEMLQRTGADVVLTGFGRGRRLTERAARALPLPAEVLALDATDADSVAAVAADLDERWDAVDGVLHAIAYGPDELWREPFLEVGHDAVDAAMRPSAYSLQQLTGALLPALRRSPGGASVVALTTLVGRMSKAYGWMHVVKGTLEALVQQMAVELGPDGVRVNTVAVGPLRTNAATGIPAFADLETVYERAPLGWDSRDTGIVAGPAAFLLSEHARGVTGEHLHVDGGLHALL